MNGRTQRSAPATRTSGVLFATVILSVLCSCGASQLPPPEGGIRLSCDSPDVLVYINDSLVGQCGQLSSRKGYRLRPGTYRIEARRDGFFHQYEILSVGDEIIDVHLSPREIPPQTL